MLHFFVRRLKELHEKDKIEDKGFTLIELLVVVIITCILAAIASPAFRNQRTRANGAGVITQLANTMLRAVDQEHRVRQTEYLEERLARLEDEQGRNYECTWSETEAKAPGGEARQDEDRGTHIGPILRGQCLPTDTSPL